MSRERFNPLNAELNPICHLLALLGGTTIVVVSRLRVKGGNGEQQSSVKAVRQESSVVRVRECK